MDAEYYGQKLDEAQTHLDSLLIQREEIELQINAWSDHMGELEYQYEEAWIAEHGEDEPRRTWS